MCLWCVVVLQRGGAVCLWHNESTGVEEAGSMGGAWGLVQGSSFSHNQVGGHWGVQGCAAHRARGPLTSGMCVCVCVCDGVDVRQAGRVEGQEEGPVAEGGAGGGAVAAEGASLVVVGSSFSGNSLVGVSGGGRQGWCRTGG